MPPMKQWLKRNDVWLLGSAVEGQDRAGSLYEVRTPALQPRWFQFYGQVQDYLEEVGLKLGEATRARADIDTGSMSSSVVVKPEVKLPAVGLDLRSNFTSEVCVNYEIEEVEAVYIEGWDPARIDYFADLMREKNKALWQNLRGKSVAHRVWFAKSFKVTFSSEHGVDIGAQVDLANFKVGAGVELSSGKVGEVQVSNNLAIPFGISYQELRL